MNAETGAEFWFDGDPGVVSALGCGAGETWRRMMAGDTSGLRRTTLPDGEDAYFGFAPEEAVSPEAAAAAGSRVGALVCEALRQMAPVLDPLLSSVRPERVGVVVGTSGSTMEEFTDNPDRIDMARPAEIVKERLGTEGPAWSVSTACSSSAKAFGSARRLLACGICDAVVVGGADARTRTVLGGFHALEAMSPRRTRPLCRDRDGLSLGEAAALFVMRRGGNPPTGSVALLGIGESSDAYHLTAPDPEGRGAERAMRAALADAGLRPGDVDYVNLHGTGTVYNDAMECAAVLRVFGPSVPCSSTKAMTGHCLGAAGALEAALCALALRRGAGMPPHAASPVDAELAPFPAPAPGNALAAKTALSNSFAFGGSDAAVILGTTR